MPQVFHNASADIVFEGCLKEPLAESDVVAPGAFSDLRFGSCESNKRTKPLGTGSLGRRVCGRYEYLLCTTAYPNHFRYWLIRKKNLKCVAVVCLSPLIVNFPPRLDFGWAAKGPDTAKVGVAFGLDVVDA